jgi:DNA replication and repair protein RecF
MEGAFFFEESRAATVASIGISRQEKMALNRCGQRVNGLADWFGLADVVAFSPSDIALVLGPPSERRRYIDMLISQLSKEYLMALLRYKRLLLNRNRLLAQNIQDEQLDAFDEQIALHGSFIHCKRRETVQLIQPILAGFYREISANRDCVGLDYEPSISGDYSSQNEWKNVFFKGLKAARKNDICTGSTSIGPHRDDIALEINSRPARTYASQGQCRSLALALRLCTWRCIERLKQQRAIFLIDDALSELDKDRAGRIYPLVEGNGQVFITVPRHDAGIIYGMPHFSVSDGIIKKV